jgi:hypothetical protein
MRGSWAEVRPSIADFDELGLIAVLVAARVRNEKCAEVTEARDLDRS